MREKAVLTRENDRDVIWDYFTSLNNAEARFFIMGLHDVQNELIQIKS